MLNARCVIAGKAQATFDLKKHRFVDDPIVQLYIAEELLTARERRLLRRIERFLDVHCRNMFTCPEHVPDLLAIELMYWFENRQVKVLKRITKVSRTCIRIEARIYVY